MGIELKSIQKDIEESRLAYESALIRLRGSYTVLLEDIENRALIFKQAHDDKENAITAKNGSSYIVIGYKVSVESRYHVEAGGLFISFDFAELDPKIIKPTKKEAEYLEIYRKALNGFLDKKFYFRLFEKRASEEHTMIYAAAEIQNLKNKHLLVHSPRWCFKENVLLERDSIAELSLSYTNLGISFTI